MSLQLSYTFNIIYCLQPIKLNTQLLYYYASSGSVSIRPKVNVGGIHVKQYKGGGGLSTFFASQAENP